MKHNKWREIGAVLAMAGILAVPNGYCVSQYIMSNSPSKIIADTYVSRSSNLQATHNSKTRIAISSTKVSSVLDGELLQTALQTYNKEKNASKTESDFVYGDLMSITGVLDLSNTSITEIPEAAFSSCKFSEVRFPATLESIGKSAFEHCVYLTKVNLPDSMTSLGENAFYNCTALVTLNSTNTLPSKLKSVGNNVFAGDSALQAVVLRADGSNPQVYKDATGLFSGCTNLTDITIGTGISIIPVAAFQNVGTANEDGSSVSFGADVKQILANAFEGVHFKEDTVLDFSQCKALAGFSAEAFQNTVNLKEVVLPKTSSNVGGVEFGDRVFANTNLINMYVDGSSNTEGIYLPDYIDKVGSGCFYGNKDMTSVSISPNIEVLSDYLFDYCTSLVNVEQRVLKDNTCKVKEIGDCAFRGTAIQNTDFLLDMNELQTIGYQHIEDENYSMNAGVWDGKSGSSQEREQESAIATLPLGGVGDITNKVSIDITTKQKTYKGSAVGSEVFADCYALQSVSIPGSVTSIASRAFYQLPRNIDNIADNSNRTPSITKVNWQSGKSGEKRTIWSGAFQGNKSMTEVVLPDTDGDALDIRAYAFAKDAKLTTIKGSSTQDNVLPATITNLSKGVFYRCSALPSIVVQNIAGKNEAPTLGKYLFEHCVGMTQATLPKSIREIPAHCFYNVPLIYYSIGDKNEGEVDKITKIGTLAFLGNQFKEVDLSKYTGLAEIGAGAFAYIDAVEEKNEECKNSKIYNKPFSITGANGQITKVTLPDVLNDAVNETGTLYLNTAPFYGQYKMTTLTTNAGQQKYAANGVKDGVFYVPSYITIGTARAVFGATAVSRTIWQVDIDASVDQENRWTDIPILLYANCIYIDKTTDVLPAGNYVQNIGKGAFYGSLVKEADLTQYTSLATIGSGKVESGYEGVFSDCLLLESVKLPQSTAEKFVLGEKTFMKTDNAELDADNLDPDDPNAKNLQDSLKEVTLGNITEMGTNAFTGCFVLEDIAMSERLQVIPQYAFKNCVSLQNVQFASVNKIDESAFENCKQLYLHTEGEKNYQLPDTLQSIETNAFKMAGISRENGMGTAVFGSQLEKIASSAFANSSLTGVDFSNASQLTTIESKAFYMTKLAKVELSGTKVATVNSQVFAGCSQLQSAAFGDEVETIKYGALRGCPQFNTLIFAATTMVDTDVFKGSERIDKETVYTAQNKGYTISVTVRNPETTILAADREGVNLPYYINKAGTSSLKHIVIDTADGTEDSSVKEYLKVHAKLTDGYYWHTPEKGDKYKIDDKTDSDYYESLSESKSATYNKNNVDVIQLDTLKAGKFALSVTDAMQFAITDTKTITTSFTTKYNIEVQNMQYKVGLYQERTEKESSVYEYTKPMSAAQNIQVASNNSKGALKCYYQIEGVEKDWIDSYDLVVKTDNSQIIVPGKNSSTKVTDYKETGYEIAATNIRNGVVSSKEDYMYFWLVPTGTGKATITVYPKGHEDWGTTFETVVSSDIKSITLGIPEAYRQGANVKDVFNVFAGVTNLFDVAVTTDNLAQMAEITNRSIAYESNYPDYVSVDAQGNATILKADMKDKRVRITATAQNTEGTSTVSRYVDITIKGDPTAVTPSDNTSNNNNNQSSTGNNNTSNGNTNSNNNKTIVRTGQTVEDAASGTTAKVSKVAENGTGGEVTITNITNVNVTKVTIPTTVTVNGVSYQVTAISDNLFSGFKKLSTVILPANITAIGNGAFQNCKKLKKIVIPKGIQSIGANAFAGCKNLKLITVKTTTLKSVGSNAFKGIHKKAKIKVPKKQYKKYKKLLSNKGQKKSVKIKK